MESPVNKYQHQAQIYESPDNGVILYDAYDLVAQRQVILKYVKVSSPDDYAVLEKEGNNQIRLNQHPNVCKIFDFFTWQDQTANFYLVLALEKCQGDLEKVWKNRKDQRQYFPESYLWMLLSECVDALAYAQDAVGGM